MVFSLRKSFYSVVLGSILLAGVAPARAEFSFRDLPSAEPALVVGVGSLTGAYLGSCLIAMFDKTFATERLFMPLGIGTAGFVGYYVASCLKHWYSKQVTIDSKYDLGKLKDLRFKDTFFVKNDIDFKKSELSTSVTDALFNFYCLTAPEKLVLPAGTYTILNAEDIKILSQCAANQINSDTKKVICFISAQSAEGIKMYLIELAISSSK